MRDTPAVVEEREEREDQELDAAEQRLATALAGLLAWWWRTGQHLQAQEDAKSARQILAARPRYRPKRGT